MAVRPSLYLLLLSSCLRPLPPAPSFPWPIFCVPVIYCIVCFLWPFIILLFRQQLATRNLYAVFISPAQTFGHGFIPTEIKLHLFMLACIYNLLTNFFLPFSPGSLSLSRWDFFFSLPSLIENFCLTTGISIFENNIILFLHTTATVFISVIENSLNLFPTATHILKLFCGVASTEHVHGRTMTACHHLILLRCDRSSLRMDEWQLIWKRSFRLVIRSEVFMIIHKMSTFWYNLTLPEAKSWRSFCKGQSSVRKSAGINYDVSPD